MTETTIQDVHEWELVASDTFVPLRCSSESSHFRGSIVTKELSDAMSLARVRSGPVRVERTDFLAQRSEHNDLLMSIQLGSRSSVHQHDRTASMRPGNAVFYESNRTYTLDHHEPGQDLLVVKIDRKELGISETTITQMCGRTLDRTIPGLSALAGFFTGVAHETTASPARSAGNLGRLGIDLIGAVIHSYVAAMPSNVVPNASQLEQVKHYIRRYFSDSRVTVDHIANAHYISVRKLHELFDEIHETPGQYLRRVRLERAAHLLSHTVLGTQTVASVAHQVGFSHPSTFSRSYKNYFGIAPTQTQNSLK